MNEKQHDPGTDRPIPVLGVTCQQFRDRAMFSGWQERTVELMLKPDLRGKRFTGRFAIGEESDRAFIFLTD